MEKILFAPLLIRNLAQDDSFRRFFSRFLMALAVLLAAASLIVFVLGWKELFDMPSEVLVGGIVYQVCLLFAAYLAVHALLIRAREAGVPVPGRPAAFTVSAAVLKVAGEAWGGASAILGAGGGILVWFAGRDAWVLLDKIAVLFPFLKPGKATFANGASLILQGLLFGALALLAGYLLASLLEKRCDLEQ